MKFMKAIFAALLLMLVVCGSVMAVNGYSTKVYIQQGGDNLVVGSGGQLQVQSGGSIDVQSGGAFKLAGTTVTPSAAQLNDIWVTEDIADLSAEATYYAVFPQAGTISKIYAITDGAISTADVTLTCSGPSGAMAGGVVTLATAGSAAGLTASATPTTNNVLTAGQSVSCVVTGGGSGGSPRGHVVFVMTR